ncbi:hypothetical protein [Microbulbifer sp. TYP-18]|uniref:hypothetical protein n=1 Tax=Microbulbifer sp. TYP-18 TaxID=3230024 RepID=UPI0034C6D8CA
MYTNKTRSSSHYLKGLLSYKLFNQLWALVIGVCFIIGCTLPQRVESLDQVQSGQTPTDCSEDLQPVEKMICGDIQL